MKGLGHWSGCLADLCVDNEEALGRIGRLRDANQFVAQPFVKAVPTGCIDNHYIGRADFPDAIANNLRSIFLTRFAVDIHIGIL